MSDTEEEDEDTLDIFQEPQDYYPPAKPHTFETFRLQDQREISLRLVGHNPLWGHLLWNAGRTVSTFLEKHATSLGIVGSTVLELGAGAGLPSLVCAIAGAKQVVVTDYPDEELIANLSHNIDLNAALLPSPTNIVAKGYLWGAPITALTCHLTQATTTTEDPRFTLLILADLLFNHSEHRHLLRTVALSLERSASARALVFFTPYRPWLLERDLNFLELASGDMFTVRNKEEALGARTDEEERSDAEPDSGVGRFTVTKLLETQMERVMFEEDRGDEALRRTVFGYELRWADLPR